MQSKLYWNTTYLDVRVEDAHVDENIGNNCCQGYGRNSVKSNPIQLMKE